MTCSHSINKFRRRFADYLWEDDEAVVLEQPLAHTSARSPEDLSKPSSGVSSLASPAQVRQADAPQPVCVTAEHKEEPLLPSLSTAGRICEEEALQEVKEPMSMNQEPSGEEAGRQSALEAEKAPGTLLEIMVA